MIFWSFMPHKQLLGDIFKDRQLVEDKAEALSELEGGCKFCSLIPLTTNKLFYCSSLFLRSDYPMVKCDMSAQCLRDFTLSLEQGGGFWCALMKWNSRTKLV